MNLSELHSKLMVLHAPMAQALPMVYEVWEDGEITLTKGGALYTLRNLHVVGGLWQGMSVSPDVMPHHPYGPGHGCIQVLKGEHAIQAQELIKAYCMNDE